MKALLALSCVLAALISPSARAMDDASLEGGYSFLQTSATDPGYYAVYLTHKAVGSLTFDGHGGVVGTRMIVFLPNSVGGASPMAQRATGTYSIGPDGSGTMSLIWAPPAVGSDGGASVVADGAETSMLGVNGRGFFFLTMHSATVHASGTGHSVYPVAGYAEGRAESMTPCAVPTSATLDSTRHRR